MANPQDLLQKVVDEGIDRRRRDSAERMAAHDDDALPVGRADLLYLWDEYRTEMLDFAALHNPLGHRFGEVQNQINDHLRYYGYTAPQGQHLLRWPVEYATALSKSFSAPDEEPRQVLYTEGQREAVDQAVRLARRVNQRPHLAVLDTGWHDWLIHADRYPPNVSMIPRMDWGNLCALLLSPVTSRAESIPPDGLRSWILAAREHQVPVIVDESVTGFGRLGTLWGQEGSGLVADITVLGGPCGGGLPLGAVVAPPTFFQGPLDVSPQSGHPWSCCAGATTLSAIHPGVLEHVEESGQLLSEALDGLIGQFPYRISGHHGAGLLRGLRFVDPDDAARFPLSARSHGLHVGPSQGDTVILAPVLISSTHEVTRGVDLIAATLMSWENV